MELRRGLNQYRVASGKALEAPDIRSCNALMENVAADANAFSLEIAEVIAKRQKIEQSLSWMFVCAIAGVDDV